MEALRKEKERLELQEATFRPVIGAEGRRASAVGGGSSNGGSTRGGADAVGGGGGVALSSASETKASPRAGLERKDSVGFKVSTAKRLEHGYVIWLDLSR